MTKTNTKELFIKTASILFATKGYNATGINEILKKSNAPKGSLYYYFPEGKEQLADEALKVLSEKIYLEINQSLDKFNEPLKGFQDHLYNIAKNIERDLFKPNISISLMALETHSFSEKLRLRCEQIFSKIQQIYEEKLIESGVDESSAKFFAMTISILIEGGIILSLTQNTTKPLYDLANNLPKLFNIN